MALILAPLAACHPKSGASSADSHAPGTTTATVPAACSQYPPGAPGVVRTFCDGPAAVKLTVGATPYTLTGGTCSTEGGTFVLNLGVVAGPGLAGPKPDYVGLSAPLTSGHFTDATMAVTVAGKTYALTDNSGELTATGGRFTGTALGGGETVTGIFTC